jgi:hypothetical protein
MMQVPPPFATGALAPCAAIEANTQVRSEIKII